MAFLTARERLIGRLNAAEARLRLLMADDGTVDASNRAQVDRLTGIIEECRSELGPDPTPPTPRSRRDVDE